MLKLLKISGVVFMGLTVCSVQGQSRDLNAFMNPDDVVDLTQILPPPPEYDGVRFLSDKAAYDKARSLRGTERWEQATRDAEYHGGGLLEGFSDAFGIKLGGPETPETNLLLNRVSDDMGAHAVNAVKQKYQRVRPFALYNEKSCKEEDEAGLRLNGSYPSGHTAIGWGVAMVLAELRPDRAEQVLKRGYDYGDSRIVCGAHWQSDIDAGRIAASVYFPLLRSNEQFIEQLAKAKKEIDAIVAADKK